MLRQTLRRLRLVMNLGLVVTVAAPPNPVPLLPARRHTLRRLHPPRPLQLIPGTRPPAVETRPLGTTAIPFPELLFESRVF